MSKDKQVFYSVRTFISQQSPKLTLTGSNMGLVLTASANLITKVPLMFQSQPVQTWKPAGVFYIYSVIHLQLHIIIFHREIIQHIPNGII